MIGERVADNGTTEAALTVARNLRAPSLAPVHFALIAMAGDAIASGLAFWFARWNGLGLAAIFTAAALTVLLLHVAGRYRTAALQRMMPGLLWFAACGSAIGLLLGGPHAIPLLAPALLLCGLPSRALLRVLTGWARDFGLMERRAVLIGGGLAAARMITALREAPGAEIRVCGIFDDRSGERSPLVVNGIPHLGSSEALLRFAREAEIDLAIVTLPLEAAPRIRSILKPLEVLPIDIHLSTMTSDPLLQRDMSLSFRRRPLLAADLIAKRVLDIFGASVALVLLSLPMALTALAIRLESPGPIFFRQMRHGYNHRPIPVLKFRSMRAESCDPTGRVNVTKGDARVTKVGRFIRRTSLDELPQLFNVLRGDLSLVGPRPHVVDAVSSTREPFEIIVEGYAARHRLRPGVTGWAQINGWRGEIDTPDKLRNRVAYDLHYMENWSLLLDLKILALTPIRLFNSEGAY